MLLTDLIKSLTIDEVTARVVGGITDSAVELTIEQSRAVVLGDFLITNLGMASMTAVAILNTISRACPLAEMDTEEHDYAIELINNESVIVVLKGQLEPLCIMDNVGKVIPALSNSQLLVITTVIISLLFKMYSI